MANKLIFIVGSKVDVYADCVKLKNGQTYTDSIYKDLEYTGQTPQYITVVNTCTSSFTIPTTTLFTLDGGFTASINSTVVPGNGEVRIPVIYRGTYNGTAPATKTGSITLNGSSTTYNVNVLLQDRPPVTQDNTVRLANREDAVVTKNNLIYSDPDGDAITHVRFNGDVSRLFTDSAKTQVYVAGTELPIGFTLYFKAPDQDAESTFTTTYEVKANNKWSI